MKISSVGVIGAGVMGSGVAQSLAQTGHRVLLLDNDEEALERSDRQIRQTLRFQTLFGKAGNDQSVAEITERISFASDYAAMGDVEFVIENVPEKWAVKRDVYEQLDKFCPPVTIFAADTSAIPITRIASVTERPDKVIGLHFMNPAPLQTAVEVIPGALTSDETQTIAMTLLSQMGKDGIVVKDSPGFVSNRVLMLTINEAISLVHENVAPAEDVDQIFRRCFGHKMGPLETADLIGLDTIQFSLDVLHESFENEKFRPCALLVKMVDEGLLGKKSGQGFYSYPGLV